MIDDMVLQVVAEERAHLTAERAVISHLQTRRDELISTRGDRRMLGVLTNALTDARKRAFKFAERIAFYQRQLGHTISGSVE